MEEQAKKSTLLRVWLETFRKETREEKEKEQKEVLEGKAGAELKKSIDKIKKLLTEADVWADPRGQSAAAEPEQQVVEKEVRICFKNELQVGT